MPAFKNRVGETYGRLFIESLAYRSNGTIKYNAICTCGAKTIVTAQSLSAGIKSCGCLRKDTTAKLNYIDRVGARQGRLTIVSKSNARKHGKVVFQAICDCGNKTIVVDSKKQSCGCLQAEIASNTCKRRSLTDEQRKINLKLSRQRSKNKQKSNPIHVMYSRLSRLHRHALSKVNALKTSRTFEQLGYTVPEFKKHIERQFVEGMSWKNMSKWQIDHIIPIATAKTEDDVIRLNQLSNLRPMFSAENNAKKDKVLYLL